MVSDKVFFLALVGSLMVSGCGGRTAHQEAEEVDELGGGSSTDIAVTTGGHGHSGAGGASGGSPSTGGSIAYGGRLVFGGGPSTGGSIAYGGALIGGRASTVGGYGGRSTSGRGGAIGATTCPSWAGCGVTLGGAGGYGGFGAFGGIGGARGGAGGSPAGGSPITLPACIPGASVACACTDGSSGAQVCRADGTFAECKCVLSEMRAKIVGAWSGTRTSPWDQTQPVKVEFRADGTYSAHCGNSACAAMYWGVDSDSADKKYSIDTVNESGTGFGQIAIGFSGGNVGKGELRNITFDVGGNNLSFNLWYGTYGPLDFVLAR